MKENFTENQLLKLYRFLENYRNPNCDLCSYNVKKFINSNFLEHEESFLIIKKERNGIHFLELTEKQFNKINWSDKK